MPYIGNNPVSQEVNISAQSIDAFLDVDTISDAPEIGQVLKWNGTNWVPDDDTGTGGGATSSDLQGVTDNGSSTTNVIAAPGFKLNADQLNTVSGTQGDIKKIGGLPYYHDGSGWREFHLFDRPDSSSVVDDEWENIAVRMDFESGTPYNYVNGSNALLSNVGVVGDIRVVSSPVKFGTKALKLYSSSDDTMSWYVRADNVLPIQGDYFSFVKRGGALSWDGDWTMEFWLNFETQPNYGNTVNNCYNIFHVKNVSYPNLGTFGLRVTDDQYNNKRFFWYNTINPSNDQTLYSTSGISISDNTWYHIALQRDSSLGQITLFFDGIEQSTIVDTYMQSFDGTSAFSGVNSDQIFFGGNNTLGYETDIYIDDLRITQAKRYGEYGTSRNFTPPTSPYATSAQPPDSVDSGWSDVIIRSTFDTNLNDISSYAVTGIGDAQVQSGAVKYGTGSLRVDSGQSVVYSNNYDNLYEFLKGSWTIEFWLNCSDLPATTYYTPIISYGSGVYASYNISFGLTGASQGGKYFYWQNSNAATVFKNLSLFTSANGSEVNIPEIVNAKLLNNWNHVTLTREASLGRITLYMNGFEIGSLIDNDIDDNPSGYNSLQIGNRFGTGFSYNAFDGYIDDLRISRFNRYTGNFTPPTGPVATTGTVVTPIVQATSGEGILALGSTPTWTGTSGWTVQQLVSGLYRVDFVGTYNSAIDYRVFTQFMDGPTEPVNVRISRAAGYMDVSVTRSNGTLAVDTGYVSIRVTAA